MAVALNAAFRLRGVVTGIAKLPPRVMLVTLRLILRNACWLLASAVASMSNPSTDSYDKQRWYHSRKYESCCAARVLWQ